MAKRGRKPVLGEARTERLEMRLHPDEKTALETTAQPTGLPLSDWGRAVLLTASGRSGLVEQLQRVRGGSDTQAPHGRSDAEVRDETRILHGADTWPSGVDQYDNDYRRVCLEIAADMIKEHKHWHVQVLPAWNGFSKGEIGRLEARIHGEKEPMFFNQYVAVRDYILRTLQERRLQLTRRSTG